MNEDRYNVCDTYTPHRQGRSREKLNKIKIECYVIYIQGELPSMLTIL